jgi:hypothetical protein
MNFLNPLYLLAALAALVPLIIHLLHRQRAKIQVFPSLEFLRRMMRRKTRRFHLKQILLLIIRVLLLLFIALALAHPTITGGRAVRGHLPTTAVIILDDSFSMLRRTGDTHLFNLAKQKTLGLLEYFDRSDEVHVLTGSSPSRNLVENGTRDAERLRGRVDKIFGTNLITDIAAPLKHAVSILNESANPNREIYIISDMQKKGWDTLDEPLAEVEEGAKVMLIDLGDEDANACVKDISFRIPAGSEDMEMEVALERFNTADMQGRVVELFLMGEFLDRTVFSPGEFSRESETFRVPAQESFLWGEVRMATDKLEIDDTRYFALPSRRRVVGVVGDAHYIRTALNPEGGGSFEPLEIEEGAVSRESLSRVDVLIVANVARFSPLEIEAISEYLAGGGSLLIFMGNMVDTGVYNRNLLPRLGRVTLEGPSEAGRSGFYTVERFERGHAVFDKFKSDESPFSDARFYQFMKVKPSGGRVIASFSDGSPAMIEVNDRVMLFASSADMAWNDLVLASQFLPIVHETLLYLSSEARLGRSHTPGDEILIRASGSEGEIILDGPSGAVRHFSETLGETDYYRITSPDDPGIYFLRTERETISVFAVNVDASESDLTKVGFDWVATQLGNFDVTRVAAEDDMGESVSLLRKGRDLTRIFLWAGLVLVVLETLLASNVWRGLRQDQEEDALTHS